MILPQGDHADELHRASPRRLMAVTDQTGVYLESSRRSRGRPSRDRTALQVSAMKLPKPIRERPSIAGTPRPGPASRRSHPIPPLPARPRHKRPKGRVMPERLLTVQEAGEMLNTGERFPRRLIAERRIRFVRVGRHVRIPESAIADYVAAQTVEAMRLRGMR